MERLLYRVVECSSESSFHPCSELEANNVISGGVHYGEGWSTSNYVSYPQTLTIEFFADACHLRRILVLSHETKISSTLEIFAALGTRRRLDDESIAEARREANKARYQRLGHLSFSTNEHTGYGAREQKNVSVNCKARFLKLIIHTPHKNPANLYRQVGIVSLQILGTVSQARIEFPEETVHMNEDHMVVFEECIKMPVSRYVQPSTYEVNNRNEGSNINDRPHYSSAIDSALLDIGIPLSLVSETRPKYTVDTLTDKFLQDMELAKRSAIDRENYNDAKKLKIKIDRVTTLGDKINSLQEQKAFCLMTEDFDTASRIKEEIDRLRKVQVGLLDPHSQHEHKFVSGVNDANTMIGKVGLGRGGQHSANDVLVHQRLHADGEEFDADGAITRLTDKRKELISDAHSIIKREEQKGNHPVGFFREQKLAVRHIKTTKTLQTKRSEQVNDVLENELTEKILQAHGQMPMPKVLSDNASGEADVLIDRVGEFAVRCLYSNDWRLREAGVKSISDYIMKNTPIAERLYNFKMGSLVALHALRDRVNQVYLEGLNLVKMLYTYQPDEFDEKEADFPVFCSTFLKTSDIRRGIASLMPLITKHIVTDNVKLQQASEEIAMYLITQKHVGTDILVAEHLLSENNRKATWREISGRLKLLCRCILHLGLSKPNSQRRHGNQSKCLTLDYIMPRVTEYIQHPNGHVRSAAINVCMCCYKFSSASAIQPYFTTLRPALLELLHAGFLEVEDEKLRNNPSHSSCEIERPTVTFAGIDEEVLGEDTPHNKKTNVDFNDIDSFMLRSKQEKMLINKDDGMIGQAKSKYVVPGNIEIESEVFTTGENQKSSSINERIGLDSILETTGEKNVSRKEPTQSVGFVEDIERIAIPLHTATDQAGDDNQADVKRGRENAVADEHLKQLSSSEEGHSDNITKHRKEDKTCILM